MCFSLRAYCCYNALMTNTHYTHPNPKIYRLTQWIIFLALIVILLTIPLQLLIATLYPQAMLFYVSAVMTLLLTAPLLLHLTVTPTVSVTEQGLTIYPFLGKSHRFDWGDIQAVKSYPLLPRQNHEVNKRLLIGRKRYQQAEGKMLLIPDLPIVYRVGGFFAGEHGRKIIALTNRTHTDYEQLIKQIMKHADKAKMSSS